MKSRRRGKPEPISYDELLGSAGMSGFLSFLNVKAPAAGAGVLPRIESSEDTVSSENTVSPKVAEPISAHTLFSEATVLFKQRAVSGNTVCFEDTVSSERQLPAARIDDSQDTVSCELTVSSEDTVSSEFVRPRRKYGVQRNLKRIQRAMTVQDGHTHAEQLLYQALWSAREARRESEETRILCGGFDRLAEITNLHWSTVKRNLKGLERKLALETIAGENCNARLGRTYRIFSYGAILRRRKAAGMDWVFRGRVVEFVDGPGATISQDTVSLEDTVSSEHRDTVCSEHTDTVSSEHRDTVCSEHTPLGINERKTTRKPSSSVSTFLADAIHYYAPGIDDDAIETLVSQCRNRQADATDEEIAHFVRLKGELGRRRGSLKNPLGFLLESVPKCFEGDSFRRFREARAAGDKQSEEERDCWERFVAEQRAVLENPQASEEDRAFAWKLLGEDSGEGKC